MSQSSLSRMPTSPSKPQFTQVSTEYKPAPTEEIHELNTSLPIERSAADTRRTSRTHSARRSWWKVLPMQLFCLAWTGPILYLLFLNFKNHVVGASAWCPKRDCWVDAFNNRTSMQNDMAILAVHSRNFNNIMQYVAKLLELWFGVIAGALIYLMVMRVAQSGCGLPVRLLTLPTEYSNLLNAFDIGLWTSLRDPQAFGSRVVWVLVILATAFTGILVNLMGPATATLILPTLKWVKTAPISQGWLDSVSMDVKFESEDNETVPFVVSDSGCSVDELALGRYSCASKWNRALDSWIPSAIDAFLTDEDTYRGNNSGFASRQSGLTLVVNSTENDDGKTTIWVSSRQAIDQLSRDRDIISNISLGADAKQIGITESMYQQYAVFNSSLGLRLRRDGAILAVSPNLWFAQYSNQSWTTRVDENRSVMCFANYTADLPFMDPEDDHSLFTKCIQVGDGWAESYDGPSSRSRRFSIDAADDTSPSISVDVYSSSRVTFLHPLYERLNDYFIEDPSWHIPDLCLNATIPVGLFCNWTHFFGGSYNVASEDNHTSFVTTLVFSRADDNVPAYAIDYVAQLGFTTYELDPWPTTNPLSLVQMPDLRDDIDLAQFPTDTSWTFLAWGVDLDGGRVPYNRSVAPLWHALLDNSQIKSGESYVHGYKQATFIDTAAALLFIPVLQALSLTDWRTGPHRRFDGTSELFFEARMYVWSYGFDSKTARLGGAVAITGCLIACLQFITGLFQRRRQRTVTQVILAALAYQSQGSIDTQEKSRMHVTDAEGEAGGLRLARWSAR